MTSWRSDEKGTIGRVGVIVGAAVVVVVIIGFVTCCLIKKNEEKRRKAYTAPTLPTYITQSGLTAPPLAHVRSSTSATLSAPSVPEQLPAYRPPQPGTNVFSRDEGDERGYTAAAATRILRGSSDIESNNNMRHTIPRRPVPALQETTDVPTSSGCGMMLYAAAQRPSGGIANRSQADTGASVRPEFDGQVAPLRTDIEEPPPGYEQVSGRST